MSTSPRVFVREGLEPPLRPTPVILTSPETKLALWRLRFTHIPFYGIESSYPLNCNKAPWQCLEEALVLKNLRQSFGTASEARKDSAVSKPGDTATGEKAHGVSTSSRTRPTASSSLLPASATASTDDTPIQCRKNCIARALQSVYVRNPEAWRVKPTGSADVIVNYLLLGLDEEEGDMDRQIDEAGGRSG